jgi:uncharacterized iron-regulated membrane protein
VRPAVWRAAHMRAFIRILHLWLGLSLGVLMLVAGLSGAVLVFYVDIDRWMHPAIQVERTDVAPDWDRALATVRAAFPDKQGPWRFEVVGDGGAIPARYYNPPETEGRAFAPMMVWLSPDGQAVLRRDFWGDYAVTWLYNLHYQLLMGRTGAMVMGYAGLASLLLLISGLWSWWPKRGRFGASLRHKPGAPAVRRLLDWHRTAGLVFIMPLVLLSGTGAMLAFPDTTDRLLEALLGPSRIPHAHSAQAEGRAVLGPSDAARVAREALPGARVAWIETPPASGGVFKVRMQTPGEPSRRFPHSHVHVSAHTGAVAWKADIRKGGGGDVVNAWTHPIHDGSFAGLPGRFLWVLAGLAPVGLFLTGLLRWRERGRRRAQAEARRTGAFPARASTD